MSGNQYIPPVNKGDKQIPASKLNSVIESVNRLNESGFDPNSVQVQDNDGRNIRDISYLPDENHPFKISTVGTTKISVTKGSWTRDQTSVTLEADGSATQNTYLTDQIELPLSAFEPSLADGTYYVYVELQSNVDASTLLFDESIIPGKLVLRANSSSLAAEQRTPAQSYDRINTASSSRDFFIRTKELIGRVNVASSGSNFFIRSIDQDLNSDIEDAQVVPDALFKTLDEHRRRTLDFNRVADANSPAGDTIHFGELQLYDVNQVPGQNSYTIPYFFSNTTDTSNVGSQGTLFWASLDKHYFPARGADPTHKTLEVIVDGNNTNKRPDNSQNFEFISLMNATNSNKAKGPSDNSYSFAYITSTVDATSTTQMQGELVWAAPDTHLRTKSRAGRQRSIELSSNSGGTEKIWQLHKMDVGGDHALAEADRLGVRDTDGGTGAIGSARSTLEWANATGIATWINTYAPGVIWANQGSCGSCTSCDTATTISGNHDHENHNFNFDDHTTSFQDRYVETSGDATRNNFETGSALGDSGSNISIGPDERMLYEAGGQQTVDWDEQWLISNAASTTVDWFYRELEGGNWTATDTTATADGTSNGAFRVPNGSIFAKNGVRTEDGSGKAKIGADVESCYGYFEYSTAWCRLADGGAISLWGENSVGTEKAYLCDGTYAAKFEDGGSGGRAVYICDGTDALVTDSATGAGASNWAYLSRGTAGGWGGYFEFNTGATGTNVYCAYNNKAIEANGDIDIASTGDYLHTGTQVVTSQQAAVADASNVSGTATTNGVGFVSTAEFNSFVTGVNNGFAQLNTLISRLETHGLIAT